MLLYTIITYIIFGVILLVAAIMYGTFMPQLVAATQAAMVSGQNQVAGLVFSDVSQEAYRVFYFLAALVQGVGNGFIAGMIETGRARAGLRHSFVMVAITYLTFTLVL